MDRQVLTRIIRVPACMCFHTTTHSLPHTPLVKTRHYSRNTWHGLLARRTLAEKSYTILSDFKNQQKLKIQLNSNSTVELNELEELKELDISLQEGAHIISQKKVNKVERLKVIARVRARESESESESE